MADRSDASVDADPPGGSRAALLALTGVVLVGICLVFTFVMAAWHSDVGRSIGASGESVAAAAAQEVDRNIELMDFSLRGLSRQWGSSEVQSLSPRLRDMVLFDDAMRAPGFGTIIVLDRDGNLAADSSHAHAIGTKFGDRDYFRIHVGASNVGLFVSKPFVSRLTGVWIVALSRRIEGPGGAFGGVVIGTLDIAYLKTLYAALGVGPNSAVTLFRTDGTIITREPFDQADVRLYVGGGDAFNRMRSSRAGTFEGESPVDGRSRIISYHRIGGFPLIQAVEVASDDAYAEWWNRAAAVAALLTILCLCVMGLCVILYRELGRRTAAEAALSRLAATDALTGLANRRRFDAALAGEWSRAAAAGEPLALLMVDADAFKAYNDIHGHQAGDGILQKVAGQIEAAAGERRGLACRWGGEEFALLLPGLDETAALAAAETLRRSVQALGLSHPRGIGGLVTVSVGVASGQPSDGGATRDLLAAADAALYLAKAEGRNRCGARSRLSRMGAQDPPVEPRRRKAVRP